MFNVGGGELLVILLVALIVLGPQRLPEAARTVGKVVGEVRRLSSGFQREVRDAFEQTDETPTRRDERAPLASAVAELDAGEDGPEPVSGPGDAATPGDDGPSGDAATPGGNGSTGAELAPEVGEALDQVVTPPEATGPPDGAGAADPARDPAGDGTGDDRAQP